MLTNEQKEAIKSKLLERAPQLACPICKNRGFNLVEAYFVNTLQTDFNSLSIGGQSIPSAALICNTCGFISQHALGTLGLLPKESKLVSDE